MKNKPQVGAVTERPLTPENLYAVVHGISGRRSKPLTKTEIARYFGIAPDFSATVHGDRYPELSKVLYAHDDIMTIGGGGRGRGPRKYVYVAKSCGCAECATWVNEQIEASAKTGLGSLRPESLVAAKVTA